MSGVPYVICAPQKPQKTMRVAYADPPYPGQAKRLYGKPEGGIGGG